MLNDLFSRRVLILLGKGGVGTTTASGALAMLAASRGMRVLAMETDARGPLSAAFGAKPSLEPVAISDHLSVMLLDGRHALEEYLRLVMPAGPVLNAVFSSRLYQFFVQAAPGLRELMALGKVYYEVERKPSDPNRFDLIIVDSFASGQALSFLKMPSAARDTFRGSIVSREADNINRMLRDPSQCATIVVAIPEALAISEAIETIDELRAIAIEPAAVLLSRVREPGFTTQDLSRFKNAVLKESGSAEGRRDSKSSRHSAQRMVEIAAQELQRFDQVTRSISDLEQHARLPFIRVHEYSGLSGADLVSRVSNELGQYLPTSPVAGASARA
ncbi:MAG TPA: ArsA family ATPase [Candidatus Binataceae bacterium]|nr:ArsA family ATPase [Candidatus Binataceae bacterium]